MPRNLHILAIAAGVAAGAASAQTAPPRPAADATPRVISTQPAYTPAMQRLEATAQHLRESIQAMAQKPPGSERDAAIAQARQALRATQQAMLDLPPQYRSWGTVSSTTGYDASVKDLMAAADTLRSSVHAMAREPAGPRRDQAIRDANRALLDTQAAMGTAYDATAFSGSTATLGAGPRNWARDCVRLDAMVGCHLR